MPDTASFAELGAERERLAESNARAARDSVYDVVVIGAGIGGLTAGALLAHAGRKVLVVEADEQPGGFARAVRRDAYVFDRADHLIMGCSPEGPFGPGVVDSVLRHLGVRDRCEFIRMDDPFYVAHFPDFELAVPTGREPFLEAHLRQFPQDARGLRRVVELSAEIARETISFPLKARVRDLALSPRRHPALFRYRNATTKEVLDRELSESRLKAVYTALWPWVGPPPGRASFLQWAAMMALFVEDGAYYCRGSFQGVADALRAGLESAGGELLLGTRVTRILAERRRVDGVELEHGQVVRASTVISNVDARETFETLLDPAQLPVRFLRRLRRLELSEPVVALYVATDLDVRAVGAAHEIELATDWDHDRAHERAVRGEISWLSVVIPTLKDPSLAPPGEHLVVLKALALPIHARDGAGFADRMLEVAEQVLPELRQHLTYVVEHDGADGRSPLHDLGPLYGWKPTPQQVGTRRLPQQTPVGGLVLAGQWTQPGHGIWTVVESGVGAARLTLHAPTARPILPLQI